jgi:BlaI family transcriptional regulator, penicillinase repressor
MKTRVKISEAEWEVMNVVWDQTPAPASDIVARLEEKKGWHARTIRTLIDRLVKKGVLQAKPDGKRYLFWPKFTKQECVQSESRSFHERVFGGEPAAMLIHLVKETDFTAEEIKELQRVLKEKAE